MDKHKYSRKELNQAKKRAEKAEEWIIQQVSEHVDLTLFPNNRHIFEFQFEGKYYFFSVHISENMLK